ncbi:MAG: protein kinase domain-containing protein [Planctomycetales bacterium]
MPPTLIRQPAPDFELDAVRFDDLRPGPVRLSSYAGRWLLLFFYPRDFSFVCPTELTAFSAHLDAFRRLNCEILALSVDSIEDHRRWFETPIDRGGIGALQFPLASDPKGEVSRAYGVWLPEGHCSVRGLFLIDPEGVVQYAAMHNTSVGRGTEETLRVLQALQTGGLCPAGWTTADGTIDVQRQLQPGCILGNFRILERLGAGAFGSVFAAHDLALDRRVAIKIIGGKASVTRDKVLAEARVAARMHHKNLCTIFAADALEGVPAIVMELIEGETLSARGFARMTGASRRQLLLGIAEGLAVAHARGVAHGDLKPANILVTPEGEAKLLDFGLARCVGGICPNELAAAPLVESHSLQADATLVGEFQGETDASLPVGLSGTPGYMAPEQTRGQPGSIPADLFALGLILAELLTGQPAVTAGPLHQVLAQIQSGDVRRHMVETVPLSFRELIAALLADDPNERPDINDVLQQLAAQTFDRIDMEVG